MTSRWKLRRSSSSSQFKAEPSFGTNSFSSFVPSTITSPGNDIDTSFLKLHKETRREQERARKRSYLAVEPEKSFFSLRKRDKIHPGLPDSWTRPIAPRTISDPIVPPFVVQPQPAPMHASPSRSYNPRPTLNHQSSPLTIKTPEEWYQEALSALRLAEVWEWPHPPYRTPACISTSASEETLGPVTPGWPDMVLHGEAEFEEARQRKLRLMENRFGKSLASSVD